MVLHVHNKDTNKPDLIIYANDFVDGSETHLAPFSCFDDTEWGRNNVPVKTWSVHVSSISSNNCVDFIDFVYIYFCVIFCVYISRIAIFDADT